MIKNYNQNSPAMDRALKNFEQAKARYEEERKKENEKRRKAENHHKYMMGGIIVKYFPECYQYEQGELETIIGAALSAKEFQEAVERIKRMETIGDRASEQNGSGYADIPIRKNGGGRYADGTKAGSDGYADLKDKTNAGGAVGLGRKCKQCYGGLFFTPFMGCAQIDHTPYGLCALRGLLRRALPALWQARGEMTFPLRPLCGLPLCILRIRPHPGEKRSSLCPTAKADCAAGTLWRGDSP